MKVLLLQSQYMQVIYQMHFRTKPSKILGLEMISIWNLFLDPHPYMISLASLSSPTLKYY